MKFKRILSALTSVVIAGSMIVANAVFVSADEKPADYILVDEDCSATKHKEAYSLESKAQCAEIIKPGCTVVVEYTGNVVEFVLQSWTDPKGEVWGLIQPDTKEDGVATFTYDSMKRKFIDGHGSDWKYLDAIHISTGPDELVVHKAYVTYDEVTTDDENGDSGDDKDDEPIKDVEISDDKNVPTVSFDSKAWTNYVKLTPDGKTYGLELDQVTVDSYQATTFLVNASIPASSISGKWPSYANTIKDTNGKLIYPDSAKDGAEIYRIGFEINASDFGLQQFNGCFFEFYHLFNEAAYDALLNNAVYIYPTNDNYDVPNYDPKILKVDALTRLNVDYYKKDFCSVKNITVEQEPITKLIFEFPFMTGYEGEIFRMDNFKITLPDGSVVANVDNYNSNFKPRNESDGKIKPNKGQTNVEEEFTPTPSPSNESKKFNPMIIVIVVVVLAVIGLAVVILLKNKNRYY